jgi:small subunit ribosomal protein S9
VADDTTPPEETTDGSTPPEDIAPPTEPAAAAPPEVEAVDPAAAESVAAPASDAPATPSAQAGTPDTADEAAAADDDAAGDEPAAPRERPSIPGADLEVDIIIDGEDRTRRPQYGDEEDLDAAAEEQLAATDELSVEEPIAQVTIDLGADARYRATGKRKTAIARVILRPGTGVYTINGKTLDEYFPRATLQRTLRQPLETVGLVEQLDVIARMTGGGVSAQAGALRHGISRALLEADPNLRGELKRRGFLTRDARAKERKKAGLKKARKKPQFSKR